MTIQKFQKRVCCVEALWEDDGNEPTIKPMLELLTQWKYWPHVHIQCGTVDLAKAFLKEKWNESPANSVLFFAAHGSPGSITLSNYNEESICLYELADFLAGQCNGRYVHFSACSVLKNMNAVDYFLENTGAAAVSGYRTDTGWAEADKPALLSDLMMLNALWEGGLDFSPRKRKWREGLKTIECDLKRRFFDCKFKIVQRER